ncbi:MAG: hypothetical protein AAF213_03770 [Pseudomonadota bacterium]
MRLLFSLMTSLVMGVTLIAGMAVVPGPTAKADISFGLGSSYIDVPFNYEAVATDYVVSTLGYPQARIKNVQLIAIRRGQFEDRIARVQAVVRFDTPVAATAQGDPVGAIVVIMRRSGSVVSHFEQR